MPDMESSAAPHFSLSSKIYGYLQSPATGLQCHQLRQLHNLLQRLRLELAMLDVSVALVGGRRLLGVVAAGSSSLC